MLRDRYGNTNTNININERRWNVTIIVIILLAFKKLTLHCRYLSSTINITTVFHYIDLFNKHSINKHLVHFQFFNYKQHKIGHPG